MVKSCEQYIAEEEYLPYKEKAQKFLDENDTESLKMHFSEPLVFGTAGLRGVLSPGSNAMNPRNVARAAVGMAKVLKAEFKAPKVGVNYDPRHFSHEFAELAAQIFMAHGIEVYFFEHLRPVPMLSYAITHLGLQGGVMITSSHNPAIYNGFKVMWDKGSQIIPPIDSKIATEMLAAQYPFPKLSLKEGAKKGLLHMVGSELDRDFCAMIKRNLVNPDLFQHAQSARVAYSPLYGTGGQILPQFIKSLGLKIMTLPLQKKPNPDFPTAPFPNPEKAEAMKELMKFGSAKGAQLILANDPDADRLGVGIWDDNAREYRLINGNLIGALLLEYKISGLINRSALPARPFFSTTVVTSPFLYEISEKLGVKCYKTLTGFKNIANIIFEHQKAEQFVFGCEESFGYLVVDQVFDKDAIGATSLFLEMFLSYGATGKGILDHLDEMYRRFGYYYDHMMELVFKGSDAHEQMSAFMAHFRQVLPSSIAGKAVQKVLDYSDQTALNMTTGEKMSDPALEKYNLVQLFLSDGTRVSLRPSGTEPKVKIYINVRSGVSLAEAKEEALSIEKEASTWRED